MFTVYEKNDFHPQKMYNGLYCPNAIDVYDIHMSNGYPMFLIYKDKEWVYRSAKLFTPDPRESKLFDKSTDKPVENFYATGRWKEAINFDYEEEK